MDAGSPRPRGQETPTRPFDYYDRLQRVREYVESNICGGDVSLAAVARVAGLAEKYFSAYFKHHVGICYHEWVSALRVERARMALERSDRPITELAQTVGFNGVRTFQRAFKKHIGMTPREFKKAVAPRGRLAES